MKIAIVHDYIKEYGGAERVLEALHEVFPDAPIYTTIYLPTFLGPHKERFKNFNIKTSFLQFIPFNEKLISPFRLLSSFAFKGFNFSKFDVVITSATGAYFPNSINKKNAKLVCYCHTPPRYLYGYHTARNWKKNLIFRILGTTANHFLRMEDSKASENVDYYIANSEEVRTRINKFYRKDAKVIYPPVDIGINTDMKQIYTDKDQRKSVQNLCKSYYLAGGRLARAKGIDVVIKAFNENKKPLKIFGRGFAGTEEELKKLAKENIEFVREVSDEEKLDLMKNAKAFIFASFDEDFGITPVEAMGVGTSVIAFKSGGVKETVVNEKTGLFYDKNSPEELNKAVQIFEKMKIDPQDCINQAEKFSKERFKKEIKEFVEKITQGSMSC